VKQSLKDLELYLTLINFRRGKWNHSSKRFKC